MHVSSKFNAHISVIVSALNNSVPSFCLLVTSAQRGLLCTVLVTKSLALQKNT